MLSTKDIRYTAEEFLNLIREADKEGKLTKSEKDLLSRMLFALSKDGVTMDQFNTMEKSLMLKWLALSKDNRTSRDNNMPKNFKKLHRLFDQFHNKPLFDFSSKYAFANKFKNDFLNVYELFWGNPFLQSLPHYKVADLVYKFCGGQNNPLVSVPLSFAAMDACFHQLPSVLIAYFQDDDFLFKFAEECAPSSVSAENVLKGIFLWTLLSLPVAYAKYQRLASSNESNIAADVSNDNVRRNESDDEPRRFRK